MAHNGTTELVTKDKSLGRDKGIHISLIQPTTRRISNYIPLMDSLLEVMTTHTHGTVTFELG